MNDSPLVKSPQDVQGLRAAAALASRLLVEATRRCLPGITTAEVESGIRKELSNSCAEPLFENIRQGDSNSFPFCACISVNEEVAHGLPDSRVLMPGDVLSVDLGLALRGWCADVATTIVIGADERHASESELVRATKDLLNYAVAQMAPGVAWSSIARDMERWAAAQGFGIVTEYVGHGIGRLLHEPPKLPAYWTGFEGADTLLQQGMVLSIEPLLCSPRSGRYRSPADGAMIRTPVHLAGNGWTVRTSDGSLAAHEERTILVTASGAERLYPAE